MEPKKNPKIALEKRSGMFFNIGLALTLLLVVSAFEWKTYGDGPLVDLGTVEIDITEVIDIPSIEIPPPPPPPVELPVIKEVIDEEIIDEQEVLIDIEVNEDTSIEDIVFDEPLPVEKVPDVLIRSEIQPAPVGGMSAFYKYVSKELNYPLQARRNRIEGRVFVQFVVDENGQLTDVKAIKKIGGGCDEEAVRVLSNAPRWNPGKQRGRPVKVRMTLPFTFHLN